MRRNRKLYDISKKDIGRGVFTLGFSAVIGIAVFIAFMAVYAVAVIAVIVVILLIKYAIDVNRYKKILPVLHELDSCDSSEFTDKASEIIAEAFSNGYILRCDFAEGKKVLNFEFIQSADYISYDEVLARVLDNPNNNKGIATNSRLSKDAASYCKRYKAHVIDRDVIIDMLLFNLKNK
ncbi:MAG: hypothetical protein Q4B92_04325 [Ruminococcus sp.]|nr:hypothetical protein [Ruminococcus sp.]